MVVFVVERYAVRETEKWRYVVRKAKIGQYARGEGGVTVIMYSVAGFNLVILLHNNINN